jgi:hypothetical protein
MRRCLLIIMCILIATLSLTGCMTKNQLLAEQSFYASKVALAKQQSSQPIFEMVAANAKDPIILQNVSAIRVFQAPSSGGNDGLQQYIQKDYASTWVNAFLQMVGIAAPWAGAAIITSNVASAFKDVAMQPKSVTTTNTNTNVSASGSSQAMSGGVMTNTTTSYANTVSGTGNVANIGGTVNQATATPTVVTQPPPVIVTQPPPIIVPPSYPPPAP